MSSYTGSDTSNGSFSPVDIKAVLGSCQAVEDKVSAASVSTEQHVKPPPKFDLGAIFAKTPDIPEDSEDISSGFSAVDVHAILAKKMLQPQEQAEPARSETPELPEESEDMSSGFSAVDVHAILAKKMMTSQETNKAGLPEVPCPVRQSIKSHFAAQRSLPSSFYGSAITPAPEPAARCNFGWRTIASVAVTAAAVGAGLAYAFLS